MAQSATSIHLAALRRGNKYMIHVTNRQHGSVLSPEFAPNRNLAEVRKKDLEKVGLTAKIFLIMNNGDLHAADPV
jgi:hypothetical protein